MPQSSIPWLETAYSSLGAKETPGNQNTKKILDWAKEAGLSSDYNADSIPWCGLFVSWVFTRNGILYPDSPLWALSWNNFGVKLKEPAIGCVLVFKRNGGGHVGFAISQDKNNFHVLGGNQSDMVSITKIDKDRCVGYRWPKEFQGRLIQPLPTKSLPGVIVSRNEI